MTIKKCIVHGCTNCTDAGYFIGDLCTPCHAMITTGRVPENGPTFIHEGLVKMRKLLSILTRFAAEVEKL